MFRAFSSMRFLANDPGRSRRAHRRIPSLSEFGASLEDRMLLSAAGGKARAADAASNLAGTRAGKEVTNLFESTLQTSPTGEQLAQLAHKLHSGMSLAALRKDLTAEARAMRNAPARAAMNVVVINGDPSSPSTESAVGGIASLTSTASRLTTAIGMPVSQVNVSQIPPRKHVSRAFAPTSTSGGSSGTSTPTTSSPTTTSTSPMSVMPGTTTSTTTTMSPSSGVSVTITTGTSTSTSTPTTSTGIGTPTALPISTLPISPLPVSPLPVTPVGFTSVPTISNQ